MCTDGDFNVGVSSTAELEKLVSEKRDKGVTLSILGFGTNNLNDEMMMHIADCGNGNYSYIDKMSEAQKVMGEELRATFVTVAKDAKAQIEFNPAQVLEYRQIGYELRQLAAEQFNDDKVDAGDIGAGKDVIVMYELTLAGGEPKLDPLRYQNGVATASGEFSNELAFIKLRWKSPEALEKPDMPSQSVSLPISRDEIAPSFENLGGDMVFYAAVAAYGQKLRNNPALAETSWKDIEAWADVSSQYDENGYRKEFLRLVRIAASLSAK